jgi:GNAT superfamily N-acetyltransferase
MTVSYEWRGSFENPEVNGLHAEAFQTRLYADADADADAERDWNDLLATHSLGWVVARDDSRLVGFVNVAWDGFTHAWIQDTMVAHQARRQGIGTHMIEITRSECQRSGCGWLHADFDEDLGNFYFQSCGFTPTSAGLIRLG